MEKLDKYASIVAGWFSALKVAFEVSTGKFENDVTMQGEILIFEP